MVWPLYIDQVLTGLSMSLLQLPPGSPRMICNGKNTCFGLEGPEFKSRCRPTKGKLCGLRQGVNMV